MSQSHNRNITTAVMTILLSFCCCVGLKAQQLDESAVLEQSRPIVFVVNKANISQKDLKWITDTLKHELDESDLMKVYARAAASPEGPLNNNIRLSKERYAAVVRYLRQFGIKESQISSEVIAEDYKLLRAMLLRTNDKAYTAVDSLMNKYGDDEAALKSALQRQDNGRLWQYLVREYFPELRAVRLVLFLDLPEFNLPEFPQDTVSLDGLFRQREYIPMDEDFLSRYYPREPRREVLSIKTNLLFDFAYVPGYDRWCPIPNVAVEYYPLRGHFTFGASFDGPWWQHYREHKYFQIRNYQLEARYYLRSGDINDVGIGNGAAFKGWYAKAYAHAGLFSICFDADRGWEGEGFGAGLGIGYVMPISRNEHWRLEFGAQFGYFWCKHDPYQFLCPIDPLKHKEQWYYYKWTLDADLFKKRQHQWSWIGPTRIDITLSYDLFYRPNHKKGISFRSWETSSKAPRIFQKGGDR